MIHSFKYHDEGAMLTLKRVIIFINFTVKQLNFRTNLMSTEIHLKKLQFQYLGIDLHQRASRRNSCENLRT